MQERTLIGVLALEHFTRVGMKKLLQRDLHRRIHFLSTVFSLRRCPSISFQELAFVSERIRFPIDSVIVQQGDAGKEEVYFIMRGYVRVVVEVPVDEANRAAARGSVQMRNFEENPEKPRRSALTASSVFMESFMLGWSREYLGSVFSRSDIVARATNDVRRGDPVFDASKVHVERCGIDQS